MPQKPRIVLFHPSSTIEGYVFLLFVVLLFLSIIFLFAPLQLFTRVFSSSNTALASTQTVNNCILIHNLYNPYLMMITQSDFLNTTVNGCNV
ncbi:hypothetical protein [Phaffia rhodozyma]|uniref:Uncharacterized protein n=1 Tax=Phaffia rhodozyma TaxID=264483 RepID=A0A0F7SH77_PHARH|nr:hypothetical protein [Phaffia rhodozyma]